MPTSKELLRKTVMVTGGAGYIGSVLLSRLLSSGYKVVCVDNLRYGAGSLLSIWGNPNFSFMKVDVTDPQAMEQVFSGYQFHGIVHLAAIVGDPACKQEPELAKKTNLDASIYLLEKAKKLQIPRFIFASTCSNYGRMKDRDSYVDETSPLAPVSLYAELKVEFESLLVHPEKRLPGFSPTALRFATVYGLSPRMRFDLTVNEFTKEITLGRKLQVFGEQFWRPYCHVRDFSSAILKVLQANEDQVGYNVFNVGETSQNYTKKMIVEEILRQVPDGQVEYIHREDDPRDYRVSFSKIREILDFQISKTVPNGIHEVLTSIRTGVIENPQDQKYYNIPI